MLHHKLAELLCKSFSCVSKFQINNLLPAISVKIAYLVNYMFTGFRAASALWIQLTRKYTSIETYWRAQNAAIAAPSFRFADINATLTLASSFRSVRPRLSSGMPAGCFARVVRACKQG